MGPGSTGAVELAGVGREDVRVPNCMRDSSVSQTHAVSWEALSALGEELICHFW